MRNNYTDHELELILLWNIVDNEGKQKELISKCFGSLFDLLIHRQIFKTMQCCEKGFDVITLGVDFERIYSADKNLVYSAFNIEIQWKSKYANPDNILRLLKKLLWKRLAHGRLDKISEIIDTEQGIVAAEINRLLTVERHLLEKDKNSPEQLAKETAKRINTEDDLVHTGFQFIEKRTNGLTRKAISGLLAMPGHFKSTILDALASSTIRQHGYRVLIVSLEDPAEERAKRIIADILDISLTDLRFKRVKISEEDVLDVFKNVLKGQLYIVDPNTVMKPEEAVSAIYDVKPDLVLVDHIQNFELSDMVQGLISAIRQLEVAAIRNNAHAMLASQVPDKQMAMREIKKPTASDAQWTSALHQKSAEMFGLFYQYKNTKNPFQQRTLNFEILKSRYADALCEIKLDTDPDKARVIGEIT